MKKEIDELLDRIIHPETGQGLVASGMVAETDSSDKGMTVKLTSARAKDPFFNSVRKQIITSIEDRWPELKGKTEVVRITRTKQKPEAKNNLQNVKKVVAIASGKGGVGKSTVASNLAVTLASMGYRTGLLDADIYGPSQPIMFGLEGQMPAATGEGDQTTILPLVSDGVSLMSIGFFVSENDALAWRGPMATSAIKQLLNQTNWGELDILLIDMPPGTGDIQITLLQENRMDGAIIVTTPQKVAIADTQRGIALFRSGEIGIPVLGIIENMSWFTPAELPEKRYYIFGKGGAEYAEKENTELLGQIPIVEGIMKGADEGEPGSLSSESVFVIYEQMAQKLVGKLGI